MIFFAFGINSASFLFQKLCWEDLLQETDSRKVLVSNVFCTKSNQEHRQKLHDHIVFFK